MKMLLYDFLIHLKYLILIIIEKVFIILLLTVILSSVINTYIGLNRISSIDKTHVYTVNDETSGEKINELFYDSASVEKCRELYDYINEKFENYSFWEYENEEMYKNNYVYQTNTDKYFFDLYNLKTYKGRNFVNSDLNDNDNIEPVIVGYELQHKYKLNNVYQEVDYNTGKDFRFEVVGVLEKNTSVPSLVFVGSEKNLDYYYFRLITEDNLNEFPSLHMALDSKVVFSEKESEIDMIEKKSEDLDLFNLNFKKVEDNITNYILSIRDGMYIALFLLFVLIVVSIIMSISKILLIINNERYEYAIKIFCGATKFNIFFGFFIQLLMIDVLATIPTLIFCITNEESVVLLLISVLITFFINIFITFIITKKIQFNDISQFLKRSIM